MTIRISSLLKFIYMICSLFIFICMVFVYLSRTRAHTHTSCTHNTSAFILCVHVSHIMCTHCHLCLSIYVSFTHYVTCHLLNFPTHLLSDMSSPTRHVLDAFRTLWVIWRLSSSDLAQKWIHVWKLSSLCLIKEPATSVTPWKT